MLWIVVQRNVRQIKSLQRIHASLTDCHNVQLMAISHLRRRHHSTQLDVNSNCRRDSTAVPTYDADDATRLSPTIFDSSVASSILFTLTTRLNSTVKSRRRRKVDVNWPLVYDQQIHKNPKKQSLVEIFFYCFNLLRV